MRPALRRYRSAVAYDAAEFLHCGISGQWKDALAGDDLARYEERPRELAPPNFLRWLQDGGPT